MGVCWFFLQEVEIRGMKEGSFKNEDNSFPKNWERIFYQTTKKVIGFVSHWISLILILNLVSPVLVFFYQFRFTLCAWCVCSTRISIGFSQWYFNLNIWLPLYAIMGKTKRLMVGNTCFANDLIRNLWVLVFVFNSRRSRLETRPTNNTNKNKWFNFEWFAKQYFANTKGQT